MIIHLDLIGWRNSRAKLNHLLSYPVSGKKSNFNCILHICWNKTLGYWLVTLVFGVQSPYSHSPFWKCWVDRNFQLNKIFVLCSHLGSQIYLFYNIQCNIIVTTTPGSPVNPTLFLLINSAWQRLKKIWFNELIVRHWVPITNMNVKVITYNSYI